MRADDPFRGKGAWLLAAALAFSGIAAGCDGDPPVDDGSSDATEVQSSALTLTTATTSTSTVPTTFSEYRLPATVDPDILGDRATEIWARVYRPATLKNQKYPLLVFLHGNHGTCGTGSNPRLDFSCEYTDTGTCPAGSVVVPNHAGYGYIAEDLASRGYIVVSINANRGITCGFGVPGDGGLNLARGRLVLKHLVLLSRWNRGADTTPASLGFNLKGRLDFTEIGLMGHSRGGEGMRAAYEQFRDIGSPWPIQIPETPGVRFRGIFEIGPVDGQTSRVLNSDGTAWTVLLPMCDGDVSDLEGIQPFDRAMRAFAESPATPKASFTVWGANHNYYNTEWQVSDSSGCTDNTPLFSTGPGVVGSPAQRETSKIAMKAFFTSHVGTAADQKTKLLDPLIPLPAELTSITRVDRGYSPSPKNGVTLVLEEFLGPTGTSTFGLPNDASGITISHGAIPEHDEKGNGASIEWTAAGAGTFFQSNWAAAGQGLDISGRESFDFRVERAESALNPSGPTDFTIQLVDSGNARSSKLSVKSYVDLRGPVGGPFGNRHVMLQSVRIPLKDIKNVNTKKIRAVRFTFDKTASGSIFLASIRAVKKFVPTAGTTAALVAAAPTAAPAFDARAFADLVDVDLTSPDDPFLPRDTMLTLHIGGFATTLSRHPGGDLRHVTFRIPRSQFAALSDGQPMVVSYGDDTTGKIWKFGNLDKARFAR